MYGYPIKGFALIRVLNGLSKTLNLAGNILPIYKKAKPTFDNAKNIISTIKNMNFNNITNKKEEKKIISSNTNNPVFFI